MKSSVSQISAYGFLATTVMVFLIVGIGGLTRLTGSGLSIVEWKPLTGLIPPLSHSDWDDLFSLYKTSPEFQKINFDMTLEAFKKIFWLEFIHRVWGRMIGLILLVPTICVFLSSSLRKRYKGTIFALWSLGLIQGGLGWYMVKSGLVRDPHVSPYRLAAHLLMAFLIIFVALKPAVTLFLNPQKQNLKIDLRYGICLGLVLLTSSFGALVAGLKAGFVYNTFPKMDGNWLPEGMWSLSPLWVNLTENHGTVQFIHRSLAMITLVTVLTFCWKRLGTIKKDFSTQGNLNLNQSTQGNLNLNQIQIKRWIWGTIGVGISQFSLGLLTLLYQVPIVLGVLHQCTAFLMFMSLIVLSLYDQKESMYSS